MTADRSGYLPVNGIDLYYEVHGDLGAARSPLLLIPGAFMACDSMEAWTTAFARDRAVIVFDQQGHGRTPDTSRPLSYEQFGEDAAALLRGLGVDRADVMGYSQGGGVALQLALRHPGLVDHLVSMSATFRRDGWHPSVFEAIGGLTAEMFADTPVETSFQAHTPEPAAFDRWIRKMTTLNLDDQQISDDEMRSITAPTMVIVGDADGVRLDHALEMFALRGGGDADAAASGVLSHVPPARLVVLPAMSHVGISAESDVLVPMVSAFLDDEVPVTPGMF
ncbi:alpha/beta fold hydrolase [Mycolicibacterium sediminis]|uniref:Oxidoreductase n=1 Tax=Mycolicibacterium sediminis TaxID=1286180 RepID=A0A7I7QVK3_9MYCO|nr:alpha/beta hydrolase [Mycolicibacterium sediminis]BBY30285.1 oxidoreductase [Mycolicibacterium sediminis]